MASWRIGYMVIPDVAVGRGEQDSGHDPDLRAGCLAGRGARRAAGRPRLRARLCRGLDAMRRHIFSGSTLPTFPATSSSRRARSTTSSASTPSRLDDAGRAAGARASRRRDSGIGVRRSGAVFVRISYGALDSDSVIEGLRRLVAACAHWLGIRANETTAFIIARDGFYEASPRGYRARENQVSVRIWTRRTSGAGPRPDGRWPHRRGLHRADRRQRHDL